MKKNKRKLRRKVKFSSFSQRFAYCTEIDENRKKANEARRRMKKIVKELSKIIENMEKN